MCSHDEVPSLVYKPPRWTWLAHRVLWGEHSSDRCRVANPNPFSITDRYDLAHGDANFCRHRGVSFWLPELALRESAWTTPYDDSVTTRHTRC